MCSSKIEYSFFSFILRYCFLQTCTAVSAQYANVAIDRGFKYGCSIALDRQLPRQNMPLYLKKFNSSYMVTEPKVKNLRNFIEVDRKKELVVACPGKKNRLLKVNEPLLSGYCLHGTEFSLDASKRNVFTADNLLCKSPVQADVRATNKRCGKSGKIYEIGFEARGWHPLILICHDSVISKTLYVKHRIKGYLNHGTGHEFRRPRFRESDLQELYSVNPSSHYKKKAQKNVFEKTIGRGKMKQYYDEKNDLFFSRGHLAPGADFNFANEQDATYFYLNVAPQWQVINSGNWLGVEKMVREHAKSIKEELVVLTGTHGILELEDERKRLRKFYLNHHKKNIPVPAYFWKVVYNLRTRQSIAFVTSNNPHSTPGTRIPFCKDACIDHDWMWFDLKIDFENVTRGITSCCSIDDLRNEIPQLPVLDTRGVMRGNFTNRGGKKE